MGNELKMIDFLTFFKKNSRPIRVLSALLSVIIMGVFLFVTFFSNENNVNVPDETTSIQNNSIDTLLEIDVDDLTMEESYRIEEYLSQGAHEFSMFIENEDSTSFNRSNLLKEFLTQEDVVNDIESNIGYTMYPSAEQIIDVNFNGNNVLMTITISTGDFTTSEEIANEYFAYIEGGNLSLFNNREVYFLDQPQPVILEEIDLSNEEETVNPSPTTLNIVVTIIAGTIISSVFGVVLATLGIALIQPFSKKISALFNYETQDSDVIVNLLDSQDNKDQNIMHAILYPATRKKLVLIESNQSLKKFTNLLSEYSSKENLDKQSFVFASSVSEVNPKLNFEEIVIVSEVGNTTKKWYREQNNQLKMYHSPKKIVKI